MNLNQEIAFGGVSIKERLILVKQLYASIHAGYPIIEALKIALIQSKGRLKIILEDVIDRVDNGAFMHEAFSRYPKHFPPLFINLIKTGEISASLEENLQRLIKVITKEIELKQKIRTAMTYPTFVFIAILGLGLSVSFLILPNILPLFKSIDAELPFTTKGLLWFAQLSKDLGYMLWVYIFGFITAIGIIAKQKFAKPFFHWLALAFPIFGTLNRKLLVARFSRTLESLLASGVDLESSLDITGSIVNNYYYQDVSKKSLAFIRKGESLSEFLSKYPKYFDQMFISLLGLGEKTGSLEESFAYIADFYESEVDEAMKNLTVTLEPILLIIVGLIVGFVALAVLTPIYSLTGSLR
jgi:type II secretory pathway component PulF